MNMQIWFVFLILVSVVLYVMTYKLSQLPIMSSRKAPTVFTRITLLVLIVCVFLFFIFTLLYFIVNSSVLVEPLLENYWLGTVAIVFCFSSTLTGITHVLGRTISILTREKGRR